MVPLTEETYSVNLRATLEALGQIEKITSLQVESQPESAAYDAYLVKINGVTILFRTARITPKKQGLFVAIWKRASNTTTEPYALEDEIDLLIIATNVESHVGIFVLPRSALAKHRIFSNNGTGGKRGMRVYTPHDIPINDQARNTQQWQVPYFVDLSPHTPLNKERLLALYSS